MPRRRLALWAAALAAIPAAAASAVPMNDLFTRQSTCAPNFNQCKNANFPSYFCCPSGQRCISLAGNTTLLCCPNGADCLRIEPVPCDISLQDGETNPDAVVKTTALGGTLSRCSTQCCPFGYTCVGTQCVMDQNQNPAPIQTRTAKPSPSSTAGSKTSATRSADATSTSDATTPTNNPSTTSAASESTSSNGPPVAAIAGGVTAAAVVLIGSAIFMFIFLRRRKKQDEPPAGSPPKLSRSTSSFGNLISGPIMAENTAFRTDFARGVQSPNASEEEPASVTADLLGSSVSSPDSGSMLAVPAPTATRAGANRNSAVAYGGGGGGYGGLDAPAFEPSPFVDMPYVDHDNGLSPPRTPRQPREPSSVSINIFADPNITPDRTPESGAGEDRRYTSMTTFTQMLDRADLGGMARGESYLPYSPGGGVPPVPKR